MFEEAFFSPAKLNLFLRVFAKREDGFHDLASVFQTISLGDWITFKKSTSDRFSVSGHPAPLDASNLIVKALQLFRDHFTIKDKLSIHLEKNIPLQGGLGGGSSNAATTLWALNHLYGSPASHSELLQFAIELGSDVPFFLSEGSAYCTGRGEKMQAILHNEGNRSGWLAISPYGLSTKEIFEKFDCFADSIYPPTDEVFSLEREYGVNDLEPIAFMERIELSTLKTALLHHGYAPVFLSGSGPTLVGMGDILPPKIEGIQFYPFNFINRTCDNWYDQQIGVQI